MCFFAASAAVVCWDGAGKRIRCVSNMLHACDALAFMANAQQPKQVPRDRLIAPWIQVAAAHVPQDIT